MNAHTATSTRSERLNLRISPDALQTIRAAAAAQQQDVTSFVLGAALDSARDVLLREQIMYLTPEGMKQIEDALDAEPRAIPELVDAIQKSRQRFGVSQTTGHAVR
ncbi:DUF1778 domain-containing protein [Sanguibacter massiliensis]|uniref:type II toxin-antitoxin system TacA family antitoxin n=1 Tax=Sanguibacter massiliensis TaxID=1973217 RepID=UPI0013E9C4AB|nr:DUF1778 domain-containing protein [Sanguibacter massiliensis]